jgi:CubicO group peptidase (beta-lactamase class C family)
MKLVISFVVFLFTSFITSFSQTILRSVNPETEGISSERLKQIDANIDQWIKEGQLNGATVIILRNGKIVYHKAFGFASEKHSDEIR